MELRQLNIHRGKKKNGHPTALYVQNSIPGELRMSVWKTTRLDKIWETFLGHSQEGFVNAQKEEMICPAAWNSDLCSSEAISWGKILVVLIIKAASTESVRLLQRRRENKEKTWTGTSQKMTPKWPRNTGNILSQTSRNVNSWQWVGKKGKLMGGIQHCLLLVHKLFQPLWTTTCRI